MSTESPSPDPPKRKPGRPKGIPVEQPANPDGRNQWTALRERQAQGDQQAAKIEGDWRERYKAEPLIQRLHDTAKGRRGVKMTGSQIKAAEIILDRLEPRLSAVEQTQLNPDDAKTPQQLLEELKPLLLAHPEWLRALGFVPAPPHDTGIAPSDDAMLRDKDQAA